MPFGAARDRDIEAQNIVPSRAQRFTDGPSDEPFAAGDESSQELPSPHDASIEAMRDSVAAAGHRAAIGCMGREDFSPYFARARNKIEVLPKMEFTNGVYLASEACGSTRGGDEATSCGRLPGRARSRRPALLD